MTLYNSLTQNKLLSEVSTFGIGGPATYYIEVRTIEKMQSVLRFCKEEKIFYFILGKGSNCLFDDRGFNGLVIHNKIDFNEHSHGTYRVGAGYSYSLLGTQTARQGWSGLEFASGIPGTVGGAVYMNAGANGGETKDVLSSVEFVHENGSLQIFAREELVFSYRTSLFQKIRGAIVAATFSLSPSAIARQKQLEIIQYRMRTQPYSELSAGCIFRNPAAGICLSAGALIDQAGLKGHSVGGAEVSLMHANFIVNKGSATTKDVQHLIKEVKETVKNHSGYQLEEEIKVVAFESN